MCSFECGEHLLTLFQALSQDSKLLTDLRIEILECFDELALRNLVLSEMFLDVGLNLSLYCFNPILSSLNHLLN